MLLCDVLPDLALNKTHTRMHTPSYRHTVIQALNTHTTIIQPCTHRKGRDRRSRVQTNKGGKRPDLEEILDVHFFNVGDHELSLTEGSLPLAPIERQPLVQLRPPILVSSQSGERTVVSAW